MNFGNLSGLVNGTEQVVFDSEVTGSAVSSISTGNILNGDEDGWYTVITRLIGAGTCVMSMRPNADSTGANYGYRGIYAENTSVADTNGTTTSPAGIYCGVAALNETSFTVTRFYAKSGAVRLFNQTEARNISGTTVFGLTTWGLVWNNTADNITSLTFAASSAVIGVGTRIIILKSNNFTGGTPTGVINTPYIQGSWVRVGSNTLAAAATYTEFTGLDGDRDVIYRLSFYGIDASGGSTNVALVQLGTAGGLDTGTNYGYQNITAGSTTITAARSTAAYFRISQINKLSGADGKGMGDAIIFSKSGFVRPILVSSAESVYGTEVGYIYNYGYSWNNTSDNITSLRISSGQVNGFAIGTRAELYALRPNG